jgi:hypothetical protein
VAKYSPRQIGIVLASAHLLGVLLTIWYVSGSTDGQASLVWAVWAVVDFPLSLAYLLLGSLFAQWTQTLSSNHPIVAQFLYLPHVLHGVIGTIWWFYVPSIVAKFAAMIKERRK